jgi:hypothetical protein
MKGIIYKITCNETGDVYYGSTTQSLNKRLSLHKSGYKRWKEGKSKLVTSYNIIDRGNYSYSLIETVECEDKRQLEQRERYYIENNECINKVVVGRTSKEYHKEWYENNKETMKECNKEYYKTNKEAIIEQQKAYYEANKDKRRKYVEANKEHYNELRRQRRAKAKLLKKL